MISHRRFAAGSYAPESLVRISVPAAWNIPPTPCAMLVRTFGSWFAASPRSCRTDYWIANMPYMPVCV